MTDVAGPVKAGEAGEDASWQPVEVGRAQVLSLDYGRVRLRWILSGGVTNRWTNLFRPQGTKTGSGAYVLANSEPQAYADRIEWEVPQEDLEDADKYVKQSIQATNARYEEDQQRQRQLALEEERRREQQTSDAETLQRQLDTLNPPTDP